ncbi:unnamed protein product, partial [Ilex paraguariensis]
DEEKEVKTSTPTDVDDLIVKVSTSEGGTKSVENLQDACLKQGGKLLSLSSRLKTSEDEKKALHVDLFKSKVHIIELKEKKKSLHDE